MSGRDARGLVTLALGLALSTAACRDRAPSCDDVAARLRAVVAAEPRPVAGDYVPVLEQGAADELVAQCRAGTLAPATVRCLTAATRASEVDRCVARDRSRR